MFWRQESTGSRFLASLKNELIIIDLFLTDTSVAKKFREANLHVTTSASFNFEQNLSPEENMEFVHSILSQELYKYGTGSYYRSLFIRVIYFFQNVTLNCYWDLRMFWCVKGLQNILLNKCKSQKEFDLKFWSNWWKNHSSALW